MKQTPFPIHSQRTEVPEQYGEAFVPEQKRHAFVSVCVLCGNYVAGVF